MPSRDALHTGRRGPVVIVSGPPGSGKSTYAKLLARDLSLDYFSTGSIFREIAAKRGLSLVELSKLAEQDPSIDFEIDKRTLEMAARGGVVIDSHLAAWIAWRLADFLVYVKAPLWVRAGRIARRDGVPPGKALYEAAEREASQWERFKRYYGVDTRDTSIFDVVVDTSVYGVEETYRIILEGAREAIKKRFKP